MYAFGVILLELISKKVVKKFVLDLLNNRKGSLSEESFSKLLLNRQGSLLDESFSKLSFVAHEVESVVLKCLDEDPASRRKMNEGCQTF